MTFSGLTFISTAKFLTTSCNTGITGSGSQGGSIVGYGYKTSMFVILPNFVAAGCTGTTSTGNNGCFGTSVGFQLLNMGIWGGENGQSTQLNGKVFLDVGIDSYLTNVLLAGYMSGAGSLTGVQFEFSGQTPSIMVVDGFGGNSAGPTQASCYVAGGTYNVFVESFCGNNGAGSSLSIASGATLISYGGLYGQTTGTSAVIAQGGTFKSFGDQVFNTGSGGVGGAIVTGANSITQLDGDLLINTNNAGSFALFFNSASSKVWAKNTSFQGGGANKDIGIGTMGTFFDQGGNTFVTGVAASTILPTCVMTTGGGTGPACVLVAGSTNEGGTVRMTPGTAPGASGTTTITFAGTFAGPSNTTPSCVFDPANTGTGAWQIAADAQVNSRSTTVPVFLWANNITALTAASTYDVDYVCRAR